MGNQIYFKIAVLVIFNPCQISVFINAAKKSIKKSRKNPLEYIAIKFDTYVIFFQNYG
jgi:hypothetical protein